MDELTLIDYGMGNLLSVIRALEFCGGRIIIAASPDEVGRASKLILPGVGAFKDGMKALEQKGLVDPIKEFCKKNRPFLGICLGMQMMFQRSHEFGLSEGLGLLPGEIVPLPVTGMNDTPHKIPHIGWNEITTPSSMPSWTNSLLDQVMPDTAFYFVHSFCANPADAGHVLAECDYNGILFPAVVRSGNLYGCQFHPEKSGPDGLSVLKNFISL